MASEGGSSNILDGKKQLFLTQTSLSSARWPPDPGVVDPRPPASRRVFAVAPEVDKQPLRFHPFAVVRTGVVFAVIVVIPSCQDGAGLEQLLETGVSLQFGILGLHDLHISRVGVDIVSQHEHQLRLLGNNGLEQGDGTLFLNTRAEGDPLQRTLVSGAREALQADQKGEDHREEGVGFHAQRLS